MISLFFTKKSYQDLGKVSISCSLLDCELSFLKKVKSEEGLEPFNFELELVLTRDFILSFFKALRDKTPFTSTSLNQARLSLSFLPYQKLYSLNIYKNDKNHLFLLSLQNLFTIKNYLNQVLQKIGSKKLLWSEGGANIFVEKNKVIFTKLDSKDCVFKLESLDFPFLSKTENIFYYFDKNNILDFKKEKTLSSFSFAENTFYLDDKDFQKLSLDILEHFYRYFSRSDSIDELSYFEVLGSF